jgi:hypothetical protein
VAGHLVRSTFLSFDLSSSNQLNLKDKKIQNTKKIFQRRNENDDELVITLKNKKIKKKVNCLLLFYVSV